MAMAEAEAVANPDRDDIVAVATPPGRGAISIVRLSGAGVPKICNSLTGILPKPRYAALCDFLSADGALIDRGLALYFPAPKSYTGEHALELHGHGSPVVMNMLVRRCLELGARLARPGEFSQRAFLNGRLDLAQAEAVADLIAGGSESAARSAMNSLQGKFSARIHALVDELTELRMWVESAIDFPEEGVDYPGDELADEQIPQRLRLLQNRIKELRASAQRGKILRDGLKVVITGPPNAGKSSLLNALSEQQRAIVSDIPGTTRDLLEQVIEIDGLPVEIIDTAGIRISDDEIEIEGVRRALDAQQRADLILLVMDDATTDEADATKLLTRTIDDAHACLITDAATEQESAQESTQPTVCVVRNKVDLSGRSAGRNEHGVALSALSGDGMTALTDLIKQHAGFFHSEQSPFIARQRHLDALRRTANCLDAGIEQFAADHAGELLAEELSACQRILGEITGTVASDDLLGLIFASFCIGK